MSFQRNYQHYTFVWKGNSPILKRLAVLPKNYFTERFLGVGFKYHTKLEYINDGWRPPLHDPFLNIGLWIYGGHREHPNRYQFDTPPYGDIETKIACYKKLFPRKSIKLDCSCSFGRGSEEYLRYSP